MKHPKTILAILLIVAIGCNRNRQSVQNDDFITVDVTASYPQKELVLQDFMDVEYIALQTCDKFVTNAGGVRFIGNKYITAQNVGGGGNGNIYLFDRSGKGIRVINRMGQSGEEYLHVSRIVIDEDKGILFVCCNPSNRILVYDLYGNYIRTLQILEGFRLLDCFFSFGGEYLIHNNQYTVLDEIDADSPPFVVVSRQDGSLVKGIHIPFEQKRSPSTLIVADLNNAFATNRGVTSAVVPLRQIKPYRGSWILTDVSSDTIFRLFPDFSMKPFIVRTPPIASMKPEVILTPLLLTDRYYFMMSGKKCTVDREFTYLVYDRQERKVFNSTLYNSDYTTKHTTKPLSEQRNPIWMLGMTSRYNEIGYWTTLDADELVDALEKGELRGDLKEVASKLHWEDNPVIMLVKHRKTKN